MNVCIYVSSLLLQAAQVADIYIVHYIYIYCIYKSTFYTLLHYIHPPVHACIYVSSPPPYSYGHFYTAHRHPHCAQVADILQKAVTEIGGGVVQMKCTRKLHLKPEIYMTDAILSNAHNRRKVCLVHEVAYLQECMRFLLTLDASARIRPAPSFTKVCSCSSDGYIYIYTVFKKVIAPVSVSVSVSDIPTATDAAAAGSDSF